MVDVVVGKEAMYVLIRFWEVPTCGIGLVKNGRAKPEYQAEKNLRGNGNSS